MTNTVATPDADALEAVERLVVEGAELASSARGDGSTELEISRTVLRWAGLRFGDQLVALTSMADETLVHLAATTVPGLRFAFLDTGYHFAETIGTRDALASMLNLRLINVTAALSVAEQDARFGTNLFDTDPNQCCAIRKVEPLNRILSEYSAWMTGMRRVEAATRSEIDLVEVDRKRTLVKINPLARWSDTDVAEYVRDNHVVLNPLRQLGYQSIGCEPCTTLPQPGEAARAGRWAGRDKTECGLHT